MGQERSSVTSVKGQAKTTVGDKPMLWWGKVEGLVYLHLASRLVLSKLILLEFRRGNLMVFLQTVSGCW